MSFTQVFGGVQVSPSQLSYQALALTVDVTLSWPFETNQPAPYAATKVTVTSAGAGLSVTMPDATLVSPGQDCLVSNQSANAVTIKDNAGGTIGAVAAGQSWLFWLSDTTTAAGSWESIQYGAGVSSTSAASLAGNGLVALSTLLNTAFDVNAINANYTAGINDRATLINSTGGALTLAFDAAGTLGGNWFCVVRNSGSGALTLDPNGSETIDGQSSKTLNVGESCFIICDGSNLFSVGYGRSVTNTVTAVNVAAPSSGTQVLTSTDVAAQIQNFSGTISGNVIFEYGTAPGFWFISNNITLAGFTATWRVNSGDAGITSANVPAGTRAILVSNGTNMFLAISTTSGTVTSVATGVGLTGGPITGSGTISMANTAVTPGAYRMSNMTVDAQGRLTVASNASPAVTVVGNLVTWNDVTGTLVADAGFLATDVVRVTLAQSMTGAKRGTPSTVAYAANVAFDLAVANNFAITLTGNVAFDNPTNQVAGQSGVIRIVQDGTGGRTASFGMNWQFSSGNAPVLSTAANAVDLLVYYVEASGRVSAALLSNMTR